MERDPFDRIVADSDSMRGFLDLARKTAPTDLPVLLEGEPGTGRSLVAEAIYASGPRSSRPLVTVHGGEVLLESLLYGHVAGAFTGAKRSSAGVFEEANGGTLLFVNIDALRPDFQRMLPRILREKALRRIGSTRLRSIDVRLICTSQVSLEEEVTGGRFLPDLYYSISTFRLRIPPLRERLDDIPGILDHFLRLVAQDGEPKRLGSEVMAALHTHPWPGNVQELEMEVRRLAGTSRDRITLDDLSPEIAATLQTPSSAPRCTPVPTLKKSVEAAEFAAIQNALESVDGNQTKAARLLDISRVWLRKKMQHHGLLGIPDHG